MPNLWRCNSANPLCSFLVSSILLCNCLHLHPCKKLLLRQKKPSKNASSPLWPLDALAGDKRRHPNSSQTALHQHQCSHSTRSCLFKVTDYLLKFCSCSAQQRPVLSLLRYHTAEVLHLQPVIPLSMQRLLNHSISVIKCTGDICIYKICGRLN